jgi:hypothetical protein
LGWRCNPWETESQCASVTLVHLRGGTDGVLIPRERGSFGRQETDRAPREQGAPNRRAGSAQGRLGPGGVRLGDAGGDRDQRPAGLDELELLHRGHQRQVAAVLRDLSPRLREARSMASGVASIFTRRRPDRLVRQD